MLSGVDWNSRQTIDERHAPHRRSSPSTAGGCVLCDPYIGMELSIYRIQVSTRRHNFISVYLLLRSIIYFRRQSGMQGRRAGEVVVLFFCMT